MSWARQKKLFTQTSLFVLMVAGLTLPAEAASIHKCSAKTRRCVIKLEAGIVGDKIQVLNERAHFVADGWILKRKGDYAIIGFKRVLRTVKRGYPVIVESKDQSVLAQVDR